DSNRAGLCHRGAKLLRGSRQCADRRRPELSVHRNAYEHRTRLGCRCEENEGRRDVPSGCGVPLRFPYPEAVGKGSRWSEGFVRSPRLGASSTSDLQSQRYLIQERVFRECPRWRQNYQLSGTKNLRSGRKSPIVSEEFPLL